MLSSFAMPVLSYGAEAEQPASPTPSDPSSKAEISTAAAPPPAAKKTPQVKPMTVGVKERERAVGEICLALCSKDLKTPEELWWACACMSSNEFMEICEERALEDRCGFPMCSQPHNKRRKMRGKGGIVKRVEDVSLPAPENSPPDFCSLGCARKAVQFAKLLGDPISAMDRFKRAFAASSSSSQAPSRSEPSTPAPPPPSERLTTTEGVSMPVVPWGSEAAQPPPSEEERGRVVGASTDEQPSTSAPSSSSSSKKKGGEKAKKGGKEGGEGVIMQTTVVERAPVPLPPVVPVEAAVSGGKGHTAVDSYVPKERSLLAGAGKEAVGASAKEGGKKGEVDNEAITQLVEAFWNGMSMEGRPGAPLVVGGSSSAGKKGGKGKTAVRRAVEEREEGAEEEDEDEEGEEVDYPDSELDQDGDSDANHDSDSDLDRDASENDDDDDSPEAEALFERRLALLEQWAAASTWHYVSRPPPPFTSSEDAAAPSIRGGNWAVDEHGCEYRIRDGSDDDEEDEEGRPEGVGGPAISDSSTGHQIRAALYQRLAGSVPKVLRAAESGAPVQPVQMAIDELLRRMKFRTSLPNLEPEDAHVLCAVLTCALTRHHLPGLQPLFGMPAPVHGEEEESSLLIKLRPNAGLSAALRSWHCSKSDFEMLVEALFGGVGF